MRVSAQYHVVYDPQFTTIASTKENPPDTWADMVHNNRVQCDLEHGLKDPDHDLEYVPYRLHYEWLEDEERQERQRQDETTEQREAIRC